ncbi:unnamed protein product, partial [Choristocarpus tenellus]
MAAAKVTAAKHVLDELVSVRVAEAELRQEFAAKIQIYDEQTSLQVSYINLLRGYQSQLRDVKAKDSGSVRETEPGVENVDPGKRNNAVGGVR